MFIAGNESEKRASAAVRVAPNSGMKTTQQVLRMNALNPKN